MAKFCLEGDVNLELAVEGLNEDFLLKVQTIFVEVKGKVYKVLVGEGDISAIPEETLGFIIETLYSLLQEDKSLVELHFSYLLGIKVRGYDGRELAEGDEILKGLTENELGRWMLMAYNLLDGTALRKAIDKNIFPISCEAISLFWDIKMEKKLWENRKNKFKR
jgi:hypothetical protein